MDLQEFIPVEIFCLHHNIEVSFITSLQEFDLIEVVVTGHERYLPINEMAEVERIIRLHRDLDINTEGVDVILQLLKKIKTMQYEMDILKSKLKLYDADIL